MDSKPTDPFDQLAERYDSWFDRHASVFQSEIEALKKVIPKAGDGLEVGVGSGRFSAALGIRIGVEPSVNLLIMFYFAQFYVFCIHLYRDCLK